jgi:hypothetical protein
MNNESPMCLTDFGKVTISDKGISIEGFEADNASCREAAIMVCCWAIGELQREMLLMIESPLGGSVVME